jgi:transcriptional regulator with XRE-family HTH domain
MNAHDFEATLKHLNLSQSEAAVLLGVTARTVRRWQRGETEMPVSVEHLLKAWSRLNAAQMPWTPDLQSILNEDNNQIELHNRHNLWLDELMERVKMRAGSNLPWKIDLEKFTARLESVTLTFYKLANGGFSPAHYRRSDSSGTDAIRDQILIEEGIVAFAEALSLHNKHRNMSTLEKIV